MLKFSENAEIADAHVTSPPTQKMCFPFIERSFVTGDGARLNKRIHRPCIASCMRHVTVDDVADHENLSIRPY